ncbi:hypothetical protein [Marinicella rhabdoformis]|uniref:hypothetical protein n=1 Tax=Marinicella rhabdoformis TaxID=2580566 RepID=UPI0015D02BB2|nr:hypothetical protein [Marinicella rhabdoformis]
MEQLGMVMLEINHILSLISEKTVADDINPDRDNGLHALFQEKVKAAVALRYGIDQRLNKTLK